MDPASSLPATFPDSPPDGLGSHSGSEPQRPIWILVAGGLGITGSLVAALAVSGLAFLTYYESGSEAALGPGIQAISLGFVGLLGLPLLFWTVRRRAGPPGRVSWGLGVLAGAMFIAGLLLGALAFAAGRLPWLLGPPAHLLAASGPVIAVAFIVMRAGPLVSDRRRWGHFLGGLWAAPPLALVLEVIALVPAGLVVLLGLGTSEDGLSLLEQLAVLDSTSGAEFARLLGALISKPVVLVVAAVFVAVIVPLIEETVKSVSIWPLISRRPSSAQAFLGGALCGCGYALFESLLLAQPGADWLASVIARAGTPLLHAFATGLVSWGLVEAIVSRRPRRLVGLFAAAVGLHGAWNFLAMVVALSGFSAEPGADLLDPLLAVGLALGGIIALLGLAGLCLFGLIGIPRWITGQADS
jgi:hypothetical protein